MLELRFIRENIELVKEKCEKRGMDSSLVEQFSATDQKRLTLLGEVESLKNKRNTVSDQIALFKRGDDSEKKKADPLIAQMRETSQRIKELDNSLNDIEKELQEVVMAIPNLCHESVPVGNDEEDNIEIKTWGEKPTLQFSPKPHWELGENLDILDLCV